MRERVHDRYFERRTSRAAVLTATTSTQDVIEPAELRTGAVVCELSLPHDVGRRVARERPDVLVIEGGNMVVPGNPRFERVREPGTEFDLNLPARTALACMAETMILALEGRFEPFTLGRGIQLEKVIEIQSLAARCGFTLADMRAFDAAITPQRMAATREAAAARVALNLSSSDGVDPQRSRRTADDTLRTGIVEG